MGAKGQSNSNQIQTYSPNPAAVSAIAGALGTAQNAAAAPFSAPVAPVAGFSPDQLAAFQTVNNSQGMANPYFTQASQLFNQSAQPPNINQFFNPLANAVTAQMQNIFGQQNVQNTGSLVQAAGGTGADRIAVGQGNLANQQGLAAGQTLAGLYTPALSAAQQEQNILQGAAYGYGALGPAAQNSVLQGAQAQLGTGGLQQQLAQAQLNAPYQQQLAALAYPFQTANFLTNSVASLAPGFGGTTYGTANQTPAQPSIYSQLLGAGVAGAGVYGGLGGSANSPFGSNPAYGGGNIFSGDAYGGSAASPLPGLTAADYGAGFGPGGAVRNPYEMFDIGGAAGDAPIDIDTQSIVPTGQMAKIAPHIPSLNMNAGQSQSGSDNSLSTLISLGTTLGKLALMKRGGPVNPYAYDDGGSIEDRFAPVKQALAEGTFDAAGANATTFQGTPGMVNSNQGSVPLPASRPGDAGPPAAIVAASGGDDDETPSNATPTSGGDQLSIVGQLANGSDRSGFADSPWLPLIAAGLGIMGGTSPFAGVNIGQGGLQGIKALMEQKTAKQKDETIDQAAQRLSQEAQQHAEDLGIKQSELDYKKQLLGSGMLSDDAARLAAEQYVRTGTMPPLGYGQVANQNRALVWQHVQSIANEQGLTGADLAAAKADFMGQQAGARTAGVRGANVDMAIEEARKTFPIAIAASDAVPRTQFVPLNKAIQMVQAGTSSPELARFVTANQAVITAYSQAMSRTGANSVHAQAHAEQLLSTVTSPQAYRAVLEQMEQEMQAAKAAPESVRQSIGARISGRPASSGDTQNNAAPPITKTLNGKTYFQQNGQWYEQ